jgi:hypothetical protein
MVSCINIRISGQIYRPGPVQCGAWWKFGIQFSVSQGVLILEVNVSRAEKLPLFPVYYFLMISAFTGAQRAEQPFST